MQFASRTLPLLMTLELICAACGGNGGGGTGAPGSSNTSSAGSGVASSSGTSLGLGSSSAPSSTASSATSSAVASSSPTVTWVSTPPAPGKVTAVGASGSISANSVVTFGQVFVPGEASTAVQATLSGTALPTQTDVKRRHPDGSIRHAIVSVQLPASATPLAFSLAASASGATGSALSLASVSSGSSPVDYRVEITEHGLKADGSATAESGQTWSSTLKGALGGGTTNQWISGPLVSEWRARVAPTSGGTPHPGLRIIYDARYQSASQGRVSIVIENVESNASRGNRTYDLRIYNASSGGTAVYTATNVLHYAHTRFRQVLYFGAGMQELMAIADLARLKNARAIPNYANLTIPESTLSARYASWAASARGLFQPSLITPGMANTGGRGDIGPLPSWTALALISGDARAYQMMFDQAERAGFWNVHWRDSLLTGSTLANADIFSIDNHPNFSLFNPSSSPTSYVGSAHYNWQGDSLPAPSLPITVPVGWQQDDAHEPSLAYLPYVITGDRFYLDELYFYANWHMIQYGYDYRLNTQGVFIGSQTRAQAWSLRTLGHAAWIAPDGDWRNNYFTTKLNNNIAWYRANVLPTNPLGYWANGLVDYDATTGYNLSVLPLGSASVAYLFAPWQHAFMAYTLHELCERGYAANDLRDFAVGFTVRMFNSAPDYEILDGTAYYLPARLKGGAYITSMAQMKSLAFANTTFASRNPGAPTDLPGSSDAHGYGGMALTALSAAIDAAGSDTSAQSAAYVFVRNEVMRNGNGVRQSFMDSPVWNIVPRGAVVGLSEAPGIYTK